MGSDDTSATPAGQQGDSNAHHRLTRTALCQLSYAGEGRVRVSNSELVRHRAEGCQLPQPATADSSIRVIRKTVSFDMAKAAGRIRTTLRHAHSVARVWSALESRISRPTRSCSAGRYVRPLCHRGQWTPPGIEPGASRLQSERSASWARGPQVDTSVMDTRGVEPRSPPRNGGVLPLDHAPIDWQGRIRTFDLADVNSASTPLDCPPHSRRDSNPGPVG